MEGRRRPLTREAQPVLAEQQRRTLTRLSALESALWLAIGAHTWNVRHSVGAQRSAVRRCYRNAGALCGVRAGSTGVAGEGDAVSVSEDGTRGCSLLGAVRVIVIVWEEVTFEIHQCHVPCELVQPCA